jgi:electron transport complex protein RnfD
MNPALAARCFLLISFAGFMGDYAVDSVSGATPLALLRSGKTINLPAAFLGFVDGCIGEVSVVALLLGAVYLLWRKVITLQIPLLVICAFLIFEGLFGGHGFDLTFLASQLCSGGLILGAFFMATDYVTSPMTPKGQIIYGVAIGFLTVVIRNWGAYPEGMSFAILIMNAFTPLINNYVKPKRFGEVPAKN